MLFDICYYIDSYGQIKSCVSLQGIKHRAQTYCKHIVTHKDLLLVIA